MWTWGRACRGISTRLPVLGFAGRPILGTSFAVQLSDARASAVALHLIGAEQTRVSFEWNGAPGCTLYARPDAILNLSTDAQGSATSTLPVPNAPALSRAG